MNKRNWTIGFSVIVIILALTVLLIYLLKNRAEDGVPAIKNILGSLGKTESKISNDDFKRVKVFEQDRRFYLNLNDINLLEWKQTQTAFTETCKFGIRLLKLYYQNPQEEMYLIIASDIIRKINDRILQPADYTIIETSPGVPDWERFIHLLRLLNTFEYLADETFENTKNICHQNILTLIPECQKLYSMKSVDNENAIYTITARLLTNYLTKRSLYEKDVKENKALEILKKKFELLDSKEKKDKFTFRNRYYAIYEVFYSWS